MTDDNFDLEDDKEINQSLNEIEDIVKNNPELFKENLEYENILSIFSEIKKVQQELSDLNKKLYERTKKT